MAERNLVTLTAGKAPALLQRHAALLDRFQNATMGDALVPLADLPALRQEVVASLQPAPPAQVAKAVTVLFGSFKVGAVIDDPAIFAAAMRVELARYPAHVLDAAISRARRSFDWLPSIAEMLKICDGLMTERRRLLSKLGEMENLYKSRDRQANWRKEHAEQIQQAAARRQREEAEIARLTPLHEWLSATYGDLLLRIPVACIGTALEAMAIGLEADQSDCEDAVTRGDDVRPFVVLLETYTVFSHYTGERDPLPTDLVRKLRETADLAMRLPQKKMDAREAVAEFSNLFLAGLLARFKNMEIPNATHHPSPSQRRRAHCRP